MIKEGEREGEGGEREGGREKELSEEGVKERRWGRRQRE